MAVSVPQSILLLLTTYPEYDILNALSSILEVLASALQNLTVPFLNLGASVTRNLLVGIQGLFRLLE